MKMLKLLVDILQQIPIITLWYNHFKEMLGQNNMTQKVIYDTYDTEQELYIQSKIDEIRAAVSNQKSA